MLPEPPLMAAVKSGDNAAVLRQLRRDPRRVDDDDISGWTALHLCAEHQNYEAAYYLLACGADPLIENEVGHTARDSAAAQLRAARTDYDATRYAHAGEVTAMPPAHVPVEGATTIFCRCSISSTRPSSAGRRSERGRATAAT